MGFWLRTDPYRDSKGQAVHDYDNSNGSVSFFNPETGESIVVKEYR
ncbi:hypothetical protein PMIT1320_00498 [Prochlorococcus marinus str. MIT 1320]|nr:hypothetical protein PMIT1320_00498 [Prochlorococcus marinus str. MIT 1320]